MNSEKSAIQRSLDRLKKSQECSPQLFPQYYKGCVPRVAASNTLSEEQKKASAINKMKREGLLLALSSILLPQMPLEQ